MSAATAENLEYEFDKANLSEILASYGYGPEVTSKFEGVRFPFELMDHQIEDLRLGLSVDRFGLFNDPRTGKTAIMQAMAIFFARYDFKSLFLMPPALFTQFEMDFGHIQNHGLSLFQLTQSPKKRDQLLAEWNNDYHAAPDVLIMSQPIFVKHSEILRKIGYTGLFFDECHMGCGKEGNKIYRAVEEFMRLSGPMTYRLILSTGSPIPNNLYDAYPIIKLKSPKSYPSRRHFDAEHVTFRQIMIRTPYREIMRNIPDHDQYKNLPLLNKWVMHNATRRTKQEVLGVEAPNVQTVPVKLSNPHMKLYRKVLKDRLFEVEGEVVDARQAQKLRQVALQLAVNPSIASDEGHVTQNVPLETAQALLDSVNTDQTKVVMFANYNATVEMLQEHFKKLNPAVIYGQNGAEKNRQQLTKFREDGTCRLLIANPIAGGVGIKAGDISQTVIFFEPVSTPGQFDQAVSRVILKGQTEPVTVYILEILGTISPSLNDLMLGKAKTLLEVTRDKKSVFDNLLGK